MCVKEETEEGFALLCKRGIRANNGRRHKRGRERVALLNSLLDTFQFDVFPYLFSVWYYK